MTFTSRRVTFIAVILALTAVVLPASVLPAAAQDGEGETVDVAEDRRLIQTDRLSGATRVGTSAAVADAIFPNGSDEAIIVSAVRFQEALAGSSLVSALDAPVIATYQDALDPLAADALRELGVKRATVLGNTAVLGQEVTSALLDLGIEVRRLSGTGSYETTAAIALEAAAANGIRRLDGDRTVLLASGEDFADALAASSPAATGGFPLVLTEPQALHPATAQALAVLNPERLVVFGGEQAVSTAVLDRIQEIQLPGGGRLQATIERIAGPTRTATAVAAAERFIGAGVIDSDNAVLVRGDDFSDNLTASTAARALRAPVLMSATTDLLSDETAGWFALRCSTLDRILVIGGRLAVTPAIAQQATDAADCGGSSANPGPVAAPPPPPAPSPPPPPPVQDDPPPPTVTDSDIPGVPPTGTVRWGAAVGGNADPVGRHEDPAAAPLGVRRTFFQWDTRLTGMIRTVDGDIAEGRLPWVSVKTPSWAGMAAGNHDGEIDEMLQALDATGGPVWLTVHHEPEGGGGVNAPDDPAGPAGHVAMNRRVRQRIDALGIPNVALVSVFMDYTWEPASGRDINEWWDDGIYDVMGVDVYRYQPGSLLTENWDRVRAFAEAKGVPMAVGEWGIRGTDAAAGDNVREWFEMAAGSHADGDGARVVALSAFDSGLHSPSGSWELRGEQLRVFHELLGDERAFTGR